VVVEVVLVVLVVLDVVDVDVVVDVVLVVEVVLDVVDVVEVVLDVVDVEDVVDEVVVVVVVVTCNLELPLLNITAKTSPAADAAVTATARTLPPLVAIIPLPLASDITSLPTGTTPPATHMEISPRNAATDATRPAAEGSFCKIPSDCRPNPVGSICPSSARDINLYCLSDRS
jgi:hypothetical protein